MNIALVSLVREESEPPLGLAYLAAYLREVAGLDDTVIFDDPAPLEALVRAKPDLIGISCLSYLWPSANRLAGEIKARLGVPVIVGGYHITALPHHLAASHFDIGVLGEGEQTLAELARLYAARRVFTPASLRAVQGIVFRNEQGAAERTDPRPLLEPLDRIPFPARDRLDMQGLYLAPRKAGFGKLGVYVSMLTSRGCPYQCSFCSPRLFWDKFRSFSPEYVVREMAVLRETYRPDGIMIWDDMFIANRNRLARIVELAEAQKLNRRLEFCAFARANALTDATADLLRRLNVTSVIFGLESGSDPVLRYLKKGSITVADNVRALTLCRRRGMRTVSTFIVGSPDETEEDIRRTLDLLRSPDLDEGVVCHLTPLPGTEVWEDARQRGLVSEDPAWHYEWLSGWQFHPELVLSRTLSPDALRAWHAVLEQEASRKRRRARLKAMRVKYLFDRRILSRAAARLWQGVRRGVTTCPMGSTRV